MVLKTARICFIIWMTVLFSGCSSFLTYSAPLKSELVDGERKTGNLVRYEYTCSAVSNKIYIEKQPLCSESVMKMRHAKKELRCFTCSVVELALFGLGLIDMIWAGSIVKESEKIESLAEYDTGKLIACGEKQVAADEPIILENVADGIQISTKTDASGMIDVENHLQHATQHDTVSMALEVHLEADESVSFKYVYVVDPGL